jgi:hypothetical protein
VKDPFRVKHTDCGRPYVTRAGTVECQLDMVKHFDVPQLRAALKAMPPVGKVVRKAIEVRIRKLENVAVACPLCERSGFSMRGLRAHWCAMKPAPAGNIKHAAPLSKEEWQAAVDAARKGVR